MKDKTTFGQFIVFWVKKKKHDSSFFLFLSLFKGLNYIKPPAPLNIEQAKSEVLYIFLNPLESELVFLKLLNHLVTSRSTHWLRSIFLDRQKRDNFTKWIELSPIKSCFKKIKVVEQYIFVCLALRSNSTAIKIPLKLFFSV